ncbi:MAG: hypothetical protein KY456_08500 [Chloroflexi bacterium]|nr:hypothetical protein [Chloroflexota bacterium]
MVIPRIGDRPRSHLAGSRLVVTAVLTGGLLVWAPNTLANAYPDDPVAYVAPVCEGSAPATVFIDAGTVTNTTTLDLSADGGTAIGDSSGGDDNLATTGEDERNDGKNDNKNRNNNDKDKGKKDRYEAAEIASAGNGGVSDAGANGGAIAAENVNSGGNVGSAGALPDTTGQGCRRHETPRHGHRILMNAGSAAALMSLAAGLAGMVARRRTV